jgi:hypothetical protein
MIPLKFKFEHTSGHVESGGTCEYLAKDWYEVTNKDGGRSVVPESWVVAYLGHYDWYVTEVITPYPEESTPALMNERARIDTEGTFQIG